MGKSFIQQPLINIVLLLTFLLLPYFTRGRVNYHSSSNPYELLGKIIPSPFLEPLQVIPSNPSEKLDSENRFKVEDSTDDAEPPAIEVRPIGRYFAAGFPLDKNPELERRSAVVKEAIGYLVAKPNSLKPIDKRIRVTSVINRSV